MAWFRPYTYRAHRHDLAHPALWASSCAIVKWAPQDCSTAIKKRLVLRESESGVGGLGRVSCRGKLRSMHQGDSRLAWPTIVWLGLLVFAFMVLSLLMTAAGTARFAISMGYGAAVGYTVGAIFDLAKGSLLIGVHAF